MYFIGIDIGSTSTKVAVYDANLKEFCELFFIPTGFSGVETSKQIYQMLLEKNYMPFHITATGYGRVSVDYANLTLTEILCHGVGAYYLFEKDCTVIDVGGQDTKAIMLTNGSPEDFIMNDKCSAGTGKFIEVMANRLGLELAQIYEVATENKEIKISSTCTVFAESEIISLMANGVSKEHIAFAIINSSAKKVASLVKRLENEVYFLTGGLSKVPLFVGLLKRELGKEVFTHKNAIYAGAIGASLMGLKKQ
ncbi:MAG: benzoyl-CoA reductase [Campylobacteraceae bacterium]|nr:benzoyl-CoA reductase [Campylobacteraceae bacterium]